VEEGHSPRDDAIEVLSEAKDLMDAHFKLRAADTHGSAAALKMAWASEMSEVCQGLALTRLIFNTHRSEDGEIESLLHEAQTLRQEAGLRAPLAETMNALGSLKQKQRAYTDAEHYYNKSLEIRKSLPDGDDHGKSREQAIAQSLVSVGNLMTKIAEEECAKTEAGRERRAALIQKALKSLQAAKEAYVRGFHGSHPKVAWALEGMADVHEKAGNLRQAQEAWAEAISIRKMLQGKDDKKQMFSKELEKALKSEESIGRKRSTARSHLRDLKTASTGLAGRVKYMVKKASSMSADGLDSPAPSPRASPTAPIPEASETEAAPAAAEPDPPAPRAPPRRLTPGSSS